MAPFTPDPPPSRERKAGESESEHTFWRGYRELLRVKGVQAGREVWSERRGLQSNRELKPRRLKEATPAGLAQFLGLLAQQPDSSERKVQQADHALRQRGCLRDAIGETILVSNCLTRWNG